VNNDEKPIANPFVVLREEFDDWAVLFDPDSGNAFGLSPTGVYLWKLLDGKHSIDDLLEDMRHHADNVPERISEDVGAFVDALAAQGLAGFDITEFGLGSGPKKSSSSPSGALGEVKQFNYERPSLVNLNAEASASGATCSSHGSAGGSCTSGGTATDCCYATGACAGTTVDSCCYAGGCASESGSGNCCNGTCPQTSQTCHGGGIPGSCPGSVCWSGSSAPAACAAGFGI
jgi:SynChlorMet cassette protein ScmD